MSLNFEIINEYCHCDAMNAFIQSLPFSFETDGSLLFENRRNKVKSFVVKLDDEVLKTIVVKRFKPANIFQKINYSFFSKSKANKAYLNGLEYIKRGFLTPKPIAFLNEKNGFFIKYCYYISDFASETSLSYDSLKNDDNLINDFVSFVFSMHQKNIIHNDMNFSNVLISRNNEKNIFSVIDINRMSVYPMTESLDLKAKANDLVRCTSDMNLYKKMIRIYSNLNGGDSETTYGQLLKYKISHDIAWQKKKKITNCLKNLFHK